MKAAAARQQHASKDALPAWTLKSKVSWESKARRQAGLQGWALQTYWPPTFHQAD